MKRLYLLPTLTCLLALGSCSEKIVDTKIYAFFQASRVKTSSVGHTTQSDYVDASIWIPNYSFSLWAGDVLLNGRALYINTVPDGSVLYSNAALNGDSLPLALAFDGSYQQFDVTGNRQFGALSDGVPSPSSDLTISYPNAGDTVSNSMGFAITWNGAGANFAHITIHDTVTVAGHQPFEQDVADNGSFPINPGVLADLAPGPITISLERGNYKVATAQGHRPYSIRVFSIHNINAVLVP